MPIAFATVRRALKLGIVVVTFVFLVGATYQGVATALERRQFPHPGRLVTVGDHQLHLNCVGEGSPTVVLEAPATGLSSSWGWVQPQIAMLTRVCSYDRAGLGWSEAGDSRYDPLRVRDELHALLVNAQERRPLLLAGQGLGAALARLFAAKFPGETAALVLIDPPANEPGGAPHRPRPTRAERLVSMSPWLSRAGVLRATSALTSRAKGLPVDDAARVRAFLNRPDHLTRAARELAMWDRTVAIAASAPLDGVTVTEVKAAGDDRVAMLSDRADAQRATAAIRAAIGHARRAR